MKWFVALVMVLTAYTGSPGDRAGYDRALVAGSIESRVDVLQSDATAPTIFALVAIARHHCPGSSNKIGSTGFSSCVSDIGFVPNRQLVVFEPESPVLASLIGGFKSGASSRPLFRPPILIG